MATVAEVLAESLKNIGVKQVWGMPGGDTLPLVDAVEAHGLEFVLVRDEASAGFAADASAQLTGTMGACVATIGPGLTNMISGVAGAYLDRAPVIAVTSRYKTDLHGSYTHMMFDQFALMKPVAKEVFRLTAANAGREIRRGIAIAKAPRPGPVFFEVPTEVGPAQTLHGALPPPPAPSADGVVPSRLRDAMGRWKRPVILVGFEGRRADVAGIAASLRAPVVTTYKAKGCIDETCDPWSAGAAGLAPAVDAVHQRWLEQADGILLIGWDPVELRDHWMPGWSDRVETVVLDSHNPTDIPARIDHLHVGPLDGLSDVGDGHGRSEWRPEDVARWRQEWRALFADGDRGPATAIAAIQRGCPDDAVITLDTGAHRITASNVLQMSAPDRLLQSNGLASMGYALPAGLASAALGHPTVVVTGDMGLQMVMGELMTARERGWQLTVVVLVDDELALIALKQKRASLPSRGVTFQNPDWVQLGTSVGAYAAVAEGAEAITAEIAQAAQRPGLSLIAVPIDPEPYLSQIG